MKIWDITQIQPDASFDCLPISEDCLFYLLGAFPKIAIAIIETFVVGLVL